MLRALAVLCLIWGLNWVVMKTANNYFPPVSFVMWRFGSGALILLAVAYMRKIPLPDARLLPWIIVSGVLQMALNQVAIQIGLLGIGAGMGCVLNFTTPLWVAIMAHFTLNEQLTRRKIFGIVTALFGLYVLMGVQGVDDLRSALILIGGAVLAAIASIIVKRWLGKCDMIQLTTWQMVFGALGLMLYSTFVPQGEIDWGLPAVLCLLYNGALASAVAFYLWNYILVRIEASTASVATLIAPVFGVLGGVIFLGEPLTAYIVAGMILIFAGIFIVVKGGK